MKKNVKTAALKIDDFEVKTSRFILLLLSRNDADSVRSTSCLTLGTSSREKSLWEQTLEGDLLVCLAFASDHIDLNAFIIIGKGLKLTEPSFFPPDKPFNVLLKHVGTASNPILKGHSFFNRGFLPFVSRSVLQELWELCVPVQNINQELATWEVASNNKYRITIASSQKDFDYVERTAASHPFGYRKAFVTLIASLGNKRVGAILVEPMTDSVRYHRSALRLFRSNYDSIAKQGVHISRIYSTPHVSNKWSIHKALLESTIVIAPSLVQQPLSVIQGISYDYHPIAYRLGFNIVLPAKAEDTFYYWKPINLPPRYQNEQPETQFKQAVHNILVSRRRVKYWLAPGSQRNISIAIEKNAWAIRRFRPNTGRWAQLQQEHVVFLTSEDKRIRAYGIVDKTEIRNVSGLGQYPLWIDFKPWLVRDIDIDISSHLNEQWFTNLEYAGLVPLPPEFGARMQMFADQQTLEGRMWVEPNPYLLHQTEFDMTAHQVFVVQSWALRETVFPVIKAILQGAGYTVRYSGDRDGQIVFDDIWLMLNESEIVLVDFTDKRPNVYLEYGMALVLGKPIVAITQDKEDIPSDTPNLKYIVYQNRLGDPALQKLPNAVQDTIADIERIKRSRPQRP